MAAQKRDGQLRFHCSCALAQTELQRLLPHHRHPRLGQAGTGDLRRQRSIDLMPDDGFEPLLGAAAHDRIASAPLQAHGPDLHAVASTTHQATTSALQAPPSYHHSYGLPRSRGLPVSTTPMIRMQCPSRVLCIETEHCCLSTGQSSVITARRQHRHRGACLATKTTVSPLPSRHSHRRCA